MIQKKTRVETKKFPFSEEQVRAWLTDKPTPFYVYDELSIRRGAKELFRAFDWVDELTSGKYINYFAVKATPTPGIMKVLVDEGMGLDASSGPEIELAGMCGVKGEMLMFSSNNTDLNEYKEAYRSGGLINLDDINQIDVLQEALEGEFPEFVSFRYNPGSQKSYGVNSFIGKPEDAKFGIPDWQIKEAYLKAQKLGTRRFGIHTMLASNENTPEAHIMTARLMFEKAVELHKDLNINFELVNLGGGLGIPYYPGEPATDIQSLAAGIKEAYESIICASKMSPRIATEYGRHVTGPHGYLITKVRSLKDTYHKYAGLDASMANLMRPGMYDSYHYITVVGKEEEPLVPQRVVGSLCENNDYFTGKETMVRDLPGMEPGDIVVIHDAGAHGHAMGFNYNGKLRCAEFLLKADKSLKQVRRAETRSDLFATIA